jgi:hypothetical protein
MLGYCCTGVMHTDRIFWGLGFTPTTIGMAQSRKKMCQRFPKYTVSAYMAEDAGEYHEY